MSFVSLSIASRTTYYPSRCFSSNRVNCVNPCEPCPRIWQVSCAVDIPVIVHAAFKHHIQGRTCCPGHVDVCQWNWEWCFSRHVRCDSQFHVTTVHAVPWNGPEIVACFTIIGVGEDPSHSPGRFPCSFFLRRLSVWCARAKWQGCEKWHERKTGLSRIKVDVLRASSLPESLFWLFHLRQGI